MQAMTHLESPSCIITWVFLILVIALAICGGVGCCIACAAGSCGDKRPGGDIEMPARAGADDLPPPPPTTTNVEARRQYVDAQPVRTCLCGAPRNLVFIVSALALVCVVPAFCGFWHFAIRCICPACAVR